MNILPDPMVTQKTVMHLSKDDTISNPNGRYQLKVLLSEINMQDILTWRNEFEPILDFARQGGLADLWMHWHLKKPAFMFELPNTCKELKQSLIDNQPPLNQKMIIYFEKLGFVNQLNKDIEKRIVRWEKMRQTENTKQKKLFFLANEIAYQWELLVQSLSRLLVYHQKNS